MLIMKKTLEVALLAIPAALCGILLGATFLPYMH
jgi:hypothetical protein